MLSRTYWAGVVVLASIVVSAVTGMGISTAAVTVGVAAFVVFVPLRSVLPESRRLAWATGTRRWVWLVGAGLFAGGVGLMYLLGDPVYNVDCPTRAYRSCATGHNWATIAYFTGILGGVIAASTYPAYRLATRGAETTAANARSGHVVVSGEVVPCDETLEAPFTGGETVCYRYAVQERHNSRLFSDGGSWHTVAVGERGAPFYVEDETGRVLVDPEHASLTLNEVTAFGPAGDVTREQNDGTDREEVASDGSGGALDGPVDASESGEDGSVDEEWVASGRVYQVDAELEVAADETPPQRIADWERQQGGVFPLVARDRKYAEDQLRPGDTVTVAGRADTFAHGYPERTVIGGDGAPATVSSGAEDHVTTHLTAAVWIGGAVAVLLTPIGLGSMLLTL